MLSSAAAESYRSFLFWLGRRQVMNWLGPHLFAPIDTWLYPRVHGGVVSTGPPVLPLLLLTTSGRHSGQARDVPLVYVCLEDELLVVASNWGRPRHPGWSSNLLANPTARVQIGEVTCGVDARLLSPEEKMRVWPVLSRFCPVWQSYAERSRRELRVFSLRPNEHCLPEAQPA